MHAITDHSRIIRLQTNRFFYTLSNCVSHTIYLSQVIKKFKSKVGKLDDDRIYMYHVVVPPEIQVFYKEKKQKRLLCTVNKMQPYNSAILSLKDGYCYINLNKDRLKEGNLNVGDKIDVVLEPDLSEYGMPVPREMEEIFVQDKEVKTIFDAMTPGKQRSLLYIIGKVKSQDKRIEKAIIMTNYLKQVKGKLDFKELNEAFKKGL